MTTVNIELIQLMKKHHLSTADVAKTLNVGIEMVDGWTASNSGKQSKKMPKEELRLLQYSLMTENLRSHLF